MRRLVISDLHGLFPRFLIDRALSKGIEELVCLGDLDDPDVLRHLLEIKMNKILVMGNHDVHLCKELGIESSDLPKDNEYYFDLWRKSPRERQYVLEALKIFTGNPGQTRGIRVVEQVGNKKICYVHGALVDPTLENEGEEEFSPYLLGRMLNDWDYSKKRANFIQMMRENFWILFRGHDHMQDVFSIDANDVFQGEIREEINIDWRIKLSREKRYIINMGRVGNGSYAVFDDSNLEVRFGTCD